MCMDDETLRQRIENIRNLIERGKAGGCSCCAGGGCSTKNTTEKEPTVYFENLFRDFLSEAGFLEQKEAPKDTPQEPRNDAAPQKKGKKNRGFMIPLRKQGSSKTEPESEIMGNGRKRTVNHPRTYESYKQVINDAFSKLNRVFLEYGCSGYVSVVFYNDECGISILTSLREGVEICSRTSEMVEVVRDAAEELQCALSDAADDHFYFRFDVTENGYEFTGAGNSVPDGLELI